MQFKTETEMGKVELESSDLNSPGKFDRVHNNNIQINYKSKVEWCDFILIKEININDLNLTQQNFTHTEMQ